VLAVLEPQMVPTQPFQPLHQLVVVAVESGIAAVAMESLVALEAVQLTVVGPQVLEHPAKDLLEVQQTPMGQALGVVALDRRELMPQLEFLALAETVYRAI
jgi:hypothetical protein